MQIRSNPADYRHQVEIQYQVKAKDSTGAYVPTWTKKYAAMAAIWPLRGKEFSSDQKLLSQGLFTIRIRWKTGIDQTMRIVFGSRIFEIIDIKNPEERNFYLDFVCKEEI